ncbi:DUF3558 domain-containing protein [Saccharopolyspora tripterygii]
MAGLALIGFAAVSGCGGGSAETPAPEPPASETPAQPPTPRAGPAKATEIADKCAIVTEEQWKSLGTDQKPRQRDSNGRTGCQYQKGEAGAPGWGAFVAVSGERSYDEEIQRRVEPTGTADLGGYPATEYRTSGGCLLVANISDKGFLLVNSVPTGAQDPGVDLCQQVRQFGQTAIQNLPNA